MSNEQQKSERQNEARPREVGGVVVVELGNEQQNTNPHLSIASESYRGITLRCNRSPSERFAYENEGCPDLPGFHIEVDSRNRRVTIYDPLTRPEHAKTREQLERYLQTQHPNVPNRTFTPLKDRVTNNCQNDLIVKWLIELYNICDCNGAQLRRGEWPKAIVDRVESNRRKAAEAEWGEQEALPQLVG